MEKFTESEWFLREGKTTSWQICVKTPRGLEKPIASVGGYGGDQRKYNAVLMRSASDLLGCVDDVIRHVCIESRCHAYYGGSCMNADGVCYVQKLLKISKKARGE